LLCVCACVRVYVCVRARACVCVCVSGVGGDAVCAQERDTHNTVLVRTCTTYTTIVQRLPAQKMKVAEAERVARGVNAAMPVLVDIKSAKAKLVESEAAVAELTQQRDDLVAAVEVAQRVRGAWELRVPPSLPLPLPTQPHAHDPTCNATHHNNARRDAQHKTTTRRFCVSGGVCVCVIFFFSSATHVSQPRWCFGPSLWFFVVVGVVWARSWMTHNARARPRMTWCRKRWRCKPCTSMCNKQFRR